MMMMRLLVILLCSSTSWAYDVVHLKSGDAVKGSIQSLEEKTLRFKVIVDNARGRGFSFRTIKRADIVFIDFDSAGDEEKLSGEDLALWVGKHARYLSVRNSRAGEFTLRYVQELLESNDASKASQTLRLCEKVVAEDWDDQRRAKAALLRLQALIQGGRGDEAAEQASKVLAESEDPALLCEAQLVLGTVYAERLNALEEKHPRWMDDDEIRPQREALFHQAVDANLYPSLFHGSQGKPAASGLWSVCQLFIYTKDSEVAKDYAQDLILLYPDSHQVAAAQRWLDEQNSQPN